jgi:biotin carboxyl carrier protein
MRRYTIEIDGRSFVIDVQEQDGDTYAVSVDGQGFQARLTADEGLENGNALHVTPAAAPATGMVPRASLSAKPAGTAATPVATGAGSLLKAPMPGLLLSVLVAPGAQVRRGQDLAVLEAMKMENIIRAPADGTVLEVCVQPGRQMAHGEVILRYEAGVIPGPG